MIHNIDPVLFKLGFLEIRYYGIIYMSGFLAGYFFLSYLVKRKYITELSRKDIDDYIFWTILSVVVGARLFEVLFYGFSKFMQDPLSILYVWEGGLSFHGGLFGVLVSTLVFCKKKNISVLKLGDALTIPGSIALCLGRFANFLNGELYGIAVDNQVNPPWYAVKFVRTDPQQLFRLPTQIFESFKNLVIFAILLIVWKKWKTIKQGMMIWIFVFCYGLFRFIIEYWKDVYTNSLFGLTKGQLLCVPMMIIALIGAYFTLRYGKESGLKLSK